MGQLLANAGLNLKAAETAKEGAEAAKQAAETAQKAAAENQKNAGTHAENAKASADSAAEQANAAKESAAGAANSATAAQESETNAGLSADAAANAEAAAKQAQQAAETAKTDAEAAKTAAGTSADAAANSAADAKKTLEAIPADYSALSGKVDENANGISELKEDTAALQKRQNVLVGSETGNPVSCDDAFSAPLCGLHIYGKSTQDGTPTLDVPVPILSAGDGGSVVVKITGKNLLNPALFQNKKYQNFNSEAGFYDITKNDSFWITGLQPCAPNTTYYLNKNVEGGCFYDSEKRPIGVSGFEFSFKTPAKCAYFCVNFAITNVNFDSQQVIVSFDRDPTYEPYHDEQLLTLQTPTGLPGIPVTSGGNYTDPTGQQWVCDEVDLERGVRVQRVDQAAFDATKPLTEQSAILSTYIETPLTPAEIAAYKALTAYAPDTVVQASDDAGIKLCYQRDVNLVVKNLEDAIASMTTT